MSRYGDIGTVCIAASAHRAFLTELWSEWILNRALYVIDWAVPIGNPFTYIPSHIPGFIETLTIGIVIHGIRLPFTKTVIRQAAGRRTISPWKNIPIGSTSGFFPLRFGRQAAMHKTAVFCCLGMCDTSNRKIGKFSI